MLSVICFDDINVPDEKSPGEWFSRLTGSPAISLPLNSIQTQWSYVYLY